MTPILLVFFPLLLFQETAATDTGADEAALHVDQRYLSGDSLTYEEKFSLARQLAHANQWKEAIDYYTILLNDYPNNPDLLLGRGLVYSWEGRFTHAEADLGTVTQGFPSYADAWTALGNLYLWWERPRLAEQAYSKWVDLRPTAADPYIARAKALGISREFSKARRDLARARGLGGEQKEIDSLLRDLNRIPSALPWEPLLLLDIQTFTVDRPPWATVTATVKHEIPPGSVILGLLQTRRFNQDDYALLADTYLNLWRRAYANLRLQFAPQPGVLPSIDATVEIFQGAGDDWELSGSYRQMSFAQEEVNIFGLSIAKYAGPWYLRGWAQFVKGNHSLDPFARATARRYFGIVDNFVEIGAGAGREVDPGHGEPVYSSTYVLTTRGQVFINQRLGITMTINVKQTADYMRRGLSVGVITRF